MFYGLTQTKLRVKGSKIIFVLPYTDRNVKRIEFIYEF